MSLVEGIGDDVLIVVLALVTIVSISIWKLLFQRSVVLDTELQNIAGSFHNFFTRTWTTIRDQLILANIITEQRATVATGTGLQSHVPGVNVGHANSEQVVPQSPEINADESASSVNDSVTANTRSEPVSDLSDVVTASQNVVADIAHESTTSELTRVPVDNSTQSATTNDSSLSSQSLPQQPSIPTSSSSGVSNDIERVEGSISVRLKYLDDRHRIVRTHPQEKISAFTQKHFSTELSAHQFVRLIFNGQELRNNDSTTLASYNVRDNCTIHCLISSVPPQSQSQSLSQTQNGHQQSTEGQTRYIGFLMVPLFGLLLASFWYFQFQYPRYFNSTSTLALVLLTFMFLTCVWIMFGRRGQHQHVD